MEKNKRGIWRIVNVFDLAVIAVAVLVLALLVVLRGGGDSDEGTASGEGQVRYTVELTEVEFGAGELINEGDEAVDKIKKYTMGTVESVEIQPYRKSVPDMEAGIVRYAEVPGEASVLVTLTSPAQITASDITVDGGYTVKVGLEANLKVPGFAGKGHIVAIER